MKNLVIVLIIFGCLDFSKSYSQDLAKAVQKNNVSEVQNLIDKGGNVNEHSGRKCFPLMYAVLNGNAELVELLLKNGAKSDTCSEHHSLLGNLDVFAASYSNYTPFYCALKQNQIGIVKLFCNNGYDVTKKMGGTLFRYPVTVAGEFGDKDIFNFLIDKGVDVTVKDYQGKNALMYSVSKNNLEGTIMLLLKGCPINDTSNIGFTPLMYAADCPKIKIEIIDFLLSKGADLNYLNSQNQSALSLSCLHNNRDVAMYLFEHGAKGKDSDSEFEANAKMNHFLGDIFLSKGDLSDSKEYYSKAKQNYITSISGEKKELAKVNRAKAGEILIESATAVAVNSLATVQANQFGQAVGMNLTSSQKSLIASSYADNYLRIFYEKEPVILYDYQLPEGASLDEQKAFHKNRIAQFEMSVTLIDGILACIEKGLAGQELDACIANIQISKK